MGTVSVRLSDELEAELDAFIADENLDRSTAVRKLLTERLHEWRVASALDQLESGEITFSKAAEIADISVWELARLTNDQDVRWVSGEHLKADLEEG